MDLGALRLGVEGITQHCLLSFRWELNDFVKQPRLTEKKLLRSSILQMTPLIKTWTREMTAYDKLESH